MVSLTLVGLNVNHKDGQLLNGSSSADATASPFVISIQNAGISVLPSIFNAVILIAVLSVGNSSVYGSSRTIAALAEQGQAPKWMGYIDRSGRPLYAILFSGAWGFLAFIAAAGPDTRNQAINWLISISGLSLIFTWGSICLCHIRFRRAWKLNGHTLGKRADHHGSATTVANVYDSRDRRACFPFATWCDWFIYWFWLQLPRPRTTFLPVAALCSYAKLFDRSLSSGPALGPLNTQSWVPQARRRRFSKPTSPLRLS